MIDEQPLLELTNPTATRMPEPRTCTVGRMAGSRPAGVFAIVRFDDYFDQPLSSSNVEERITITKIVATNERAETEVARLNALKEHANGRIRYFAQYTRLRLDEGEDTACVAPPLVDQSSRAVLQSSGGVRAVDTMPIDIDTSIGQVTGEFWSDDLCGITSPVRDADRQVSTASELAELLTAVAVPSDEALTLANRVWEQKIAPQREAWRADSR